MAWGAEAKVRQYRIQKPHIMSNGYDAIISDQYIGYKTISLW